MIHPILSGFGRLCGPFLVPAKFHMAVGRGRCPGRPTGRRGTRLVLDAGKAGRSLRLSGTWCAGSALFAALTLAASAAQSAQVLPARAATSSEAELAIGEAAARFELAPDLIRAVLWAESGGQADVISPKGAMGLMQLMPPTWREMRAALGLGDDPFRARDNILAGAGYLRRLLDRFGASGVLAAYNAGPGRYQRHLDTGAALPEETVAYVARVRLRLSRTVLIKPAEVTDWRQAVLFAESGGPHPETGSELFAPPSKRVRP